MLDENALLAQAKRSEFSGHEPIDCGGDSRCGPAAHVLVLDRERALSASDDNTLRLWDLGSGLEIACFTQATRR